MGGGGGRLGGVGRQGGASCEPWRCVLRGAAGRRTHTRTCRMPLPQMGISTSSTSSTALDTLVRHAAALPSSSNDDAEGRAAVKAVVDAYLRLPFTQPPQPPSEVGAATAPRAV